MNDIQNMYRLKKKKETFFIIPILARKSSKDTPRAEKPAGAQRDVSYRDEIVDNDSRSCSLHTKRHGQSGYISAKDETAARRAEVRSLSLSAPFGPVGESLAVINEDFVVWGLRTR